MKGIEEKRGKGKSVGMDFVKEEVLGNPFTICYVISAAP